MMAQHVHPGDPGYAPPLIRPPSPASSIGTVYGADETSDTELSQDAFEKTIEEKLKLGDVSDAEARANRHVLLPRARTADDEKTIFEHVMINLRKEVRKLEEDELFERTVLRGSQVAQEPHPSSDDIDTIMRSMMGHAEAEPPQSDSPERLSGPPFSIDFDFAQASRQHNPFRAENGVNGGRKPRSKGKGKGRDPF